MPPDEIRIHGLDVPTRIGVPDAERSGWQNLQVDLTLRLKRRVEECEDDLSRTVDYASVAEKVRMLAAERPRRLLETLVAEMTACLLAEFGAASVRVEARKRILPGADWVSVVSERSGEGQRRE